VSMLTRCLEYLDKNLIRYSHSIHSPAYTAREVASADCIPTHNLAKTLVYWDGNGYGMAVVPADCFVDLEEVRNLLGLTGIRLATETELGGLFPDCEVGAMPPLGDLIAMPVLVDEEFASGQLIAFNAGTHRDMIHMRFGDFRRLVNPLVASFAVKEGAGVSR
jgi:Ala-tRNA(Pro) deacylase